jgi:UDP-N-acetylglucosamine--N-acetylmuramyl-(pentapeptide) pyrophosphoryl-undecaprenol N-acetylglucosamine transferase
MSPPSTILLAGGGTGGHLYPGIAVAEALRQVLPEAKPLFLCTLRPIDRTILEPTGFEFIPQPIVPPVRTVGGLLKFWKSWRDTKDQVRQILRDRQPAACLGLGGYAAGVAVKMAAHAKLPTAILNPDVIPGKANQYLMQFVQAVCCQFDATAQHTPEPFRSKLNTTGCPIRADIQALPTREAAAQRLGLDPHLNTLMITGASQGAKTVNDAVIATLGQIKLQGWQILHLAGKEHADAVRAGYRDLNLTARVIDFTPAMADIWAVTTLAICRSGASTCAELTAVGCPSLLMPYPFHKDMHQRANAQVLADAGAAVVVNDERDARKNAAALQPLLEALLYDATRRNTMAAAARSLGKPRAAAAVADVIAQLLHSNR